MIGVKHIEPQQLGSMRSIDSNSCAGKFALNDYVTVDLTGPVGCLINSHCEPKFMKMEEQSDQGPTRIYRRQGFYHKLLLAVILLKNN